ncbi:MAG: glycerol-3-phosphate 1-O-acyltransferase PlsY [Verrucomicrobiota bacterium]
MPSLIEIVAVAIVGYLIGSISFAVIIAKRMGVNILQEGSGNPGATNVKRVLGKKAGNLCFALDFVKGLVAAGWPLLPFVGASDPIALGIIGLIAGILGHSFSLFLKFKGGKGVATTMGGLLALAPFVLLLGLLLWLVLFYTTRYVSVASIGFGVSLPVTGMFLTGGKLWLELFLVALAVLIVLRHKANIQRLLTGTESRFVKKDKA